MHALIVGDVATCAGASAEHHSNVGHGQNDRQAPGRGALQADVPGVLVEAVAESVEEGALGVEGEEAQVGDGGGEEDGVQEQPHWAQR